MIGKVKLRQFQSCHFCANGRCQYINALVKPLLSSGKLGMMFPDKPKSKNQKYTTVHSK